MSEATELEAATDPAGRLDELVMRMREKAEHDFLMLLTDGKGFQEPTTLVWPPKPKPYVPRGVISLDPCA